MVQDATGNAGCAAVSYPLSPLQQGMLFHRLQGGAPGLDVEQVICELRHPVSAPEFEQAWQLMVRRHDALRSTFEWGEGEEPRQRVVAAGEVAMPVRVLDFARDDDAQRMVEQYIAADRRAGFRMLAAPLARVALFRGVDRAWFVFTYHHLVLDARGMLTLFRQALDAHDELAQGRAVQLPAVRPYRDYISWLQTLDLNRAELFWREQLQGLPAPTELPLPHPTELVAPDAGPGQLAFRFTAAETARLREAARRHQVTLNTVLQAAWAIVLSRYTGEDDVVFGAVRACRHVPLEGADALVGLLVNTVPRRVRLASAASIGHWLQALREEWVALRDYEHTPLMKIQSWSEAAPGRPLFDTLFNFHEPSWIAALGRLGGAWRDRSFEIRSQPNYPLALDIFGDDAVLVLAFHDRRRLASDAVARLLGHFRTAALSLADPRVDTVGQVAMLDRAERDQLLVGFNRTESDYPRHTCVHSRFEQHASTMPERIAVSDSRRSLTYGELNAHANALARRLQSRGVGPDVPVAVCLDRSVELIVAWMAVLKAGGAFVPLDPDYPRERLAFQLRDSGAPVVVTDTATAGVLPELPAGQTRVDVDLAGAPGEGDSSGDVRSPATSRNLAYIIYTSGSTGQPKGVPIEHRSLMNLVTWHQRTYAVTPEDRATQLASPAFDASVWEVWPYLTAGASVHIPDDETRLAPSQLWRWFAAQKITLSFLPTPLAEAALAEPWPAGMVLRTLLTGGDQLKRPAPPTFGCTLVNHYGPTESTVVATAGVVTRGGVETPPIGRPIANTTAYVLDRSLRLVPIGVPGELYLAGEGLARGYLGRPELTAEKFVPSTLTPAPAAAAGVDLPGFSSQPLALNGARPAPRLYRTGDLVRWRADGQLEFMGRLDHQVKVRGCRIELGEIEAALQRHPEVREAVVLARSDRAGQMQLAGYVIGAPGPAASESDLLEFLRRSLPAYMVPAAIVTLDHWPLTPNGKIDRAALPAPEVRSKAAPGAFAPPCTPEEMTIARVWMEVLGSRPVGLHDNFFELGGHSLLAAQAITRLNAVLGASISVRMLFDHPTVAEFAGELERHRGDLAPRPALRAKRRPPAPQLELVPPR